MTALRPGTNVSVSASPPARGIEGPTATLYLPHIFARGIGNTPITVKSMSEFLTKLGDRLTTSIAYDAAEFFFAMGGKRIHASRVLGPNPVAATATLFDASGSTGTDDALLLTLKGQHAYDNGFNYEVTVDGTDFEITITHDTEDYTESSGTLADRAAAVAWTSESEYVTVTLGDSNEDPRAQTGSFSGGTDDSGNAVDAQWQAALDALPSTLGPGQLLLAGKTTTAAHAMGFVHAAGRNRHYIADLADRASISAMKTARATLEASNPAEARFGRFVSSWLDVSGLPSLPGTTRAIPASAVWAGLMAYNDTHGLNPNKAAAGYVNGLASVALGVRWPTDGVPFTPEEIDELNTAGVNTLIEDPQTGEVVFWGNRTAVDPEGQYAAWLDASQSRLGMALKYECEEIARPFVFGDITDVEIKRFGGLIRDKLKEHYDAGALYGDTPQDAYLVDVDTPNTDETAEAGEINADVSFVATEHGELVSISITKRRITEGVA